MAAISQVRELARKDLRERVERLATAVDEDGADFAQVAGLADAELPPAGPQRDIAQGDLGGPGLWLRAEPEYDPKQADALAAIIAMELLA